MSNKYLNANADGVQHESTLLAWTPKKITVTEAKDVIVKETAGIVARLLVTAGTATIKDGDDEVWAPLAAQGDDEFFAPLFCSENITVSFTEAGTAYILYR